MLDRLEHNDNFSSEYINELIRKDQIKLIMHYPFYGLLLMKIQVQIDQYACQMTLSFNERIMISLNPKWYAALEGQERLKNWIHILAHLILLHPARRFQKDVSVWSIACDLAVNELVSPDMVLESSPNVCLMNQRLKLNLKPGKLADYYYDELFNLEEALFFDNTDKQINLLLPTNQKLKVQKMDDLEITSSDLRILESELSSFIDDQIKLGEVSNALIEKQSEIYQAYHIHWRILLKKFITGKGHITKKTTYKKVSRRFDQMPGKRRQLGIDAFVAIDESGSIQPETWHMFLNELKLLKKITNVNFLTSRFDHTCSQPIPLESFVKEAEIQKKGSTDYRPIFEIVERRRIRLVIIFTDGEGIFPQNTQSNVLWLLTKRTKIPNHLGHVIYINE